MVFGSVFSCTRKCEMEGWGVGVEERGHKVNTVLNVHRNRTAY